MTRIFPFPLVLAVACAAPVAALDQGQATGAQTYGKVCAACHATGAAGAPKLIERTAWRPRINKGKATLYKHAISGIGAMPAKGGAVNLTDAEVKAAVDFMVATVTRTGAATTGAGLPSPEQLIEAPVSSLRIARTPEIKNPYAGDLAAVGRGNSLFTTMNCVGCHAPGGGGGMGPPLSDDVWIYGSKPADIYLTLSHGRPNGMPAFGGALSPKEIWSLVAYVKTLQQ